MMTTFACFLMQICVKMTLYIILIYMSSCEITPESNIFLINPCLTMEMTEYQFSVTIF